MSAYTDLQRNAEKEMEATDLEMCVLYCGDKMKYDISYINVEAAAAGLAAKDAEIAALTERVKKQKRILEDCEWGASDDWGIYCPRCAEYKSKGHAKDCELAAALQEAQ